MKQERQDEALPHVLLAVLQSCYVLSPEWLVFGLSDSLPTILDKTDCDFFVRLVFSQRNRVKIRLKFAIVQAFENSCCESSFRVLMTYTWCMIKLLKCVVLLTHERCWMLNQLYWREYGLFITWKFVISQSLISHFVMGSFAILWFYACHINRMATTGFVAFVGTSERVGSRKGGEGTKKQARQDSRKRVLMSGRKHSGMRLSGFNPPTLLFNPLVCLWAAQSSVCEDPPQQTSLLLSHVKPLY